MQKKKESLAKVAEDRRIEMNRNKREFRDRLMKEFEPIATKRGFSLEDFSKFMGGKQVYGFYVCDENEDTILVVVVYDGDIEGCYDIRYAPDQDFMYGDINHFFQTDIFDDTADVGKSLYYATRRILNNPTL